MRYNPNWIKSIKEKYPEGTRIHLENMEDPFAPVPSGTEGTVDFVDDAGQIHMKWDNGRSLALVPGEDSFHKILETLQAIKLYMPLSVKQYERGEFGQEEDYSIELSQETVLSYQEEILTAILDVRNSEQEECAILQYYHEKDSISRKVQSLFFTVEQVGNKLMGVAEGQVKGKLNESELASLKEYVTGQASDGFGEGFEQRPITVGEDEIYVSLWSGSEDWNVMTQEEMEAWHQQMDGGMQIG